MEKRIQIALVGDFDANMYTHVALNDSIAHCRPHLHVKADATWVPTEVLNDNFLASHPYAGFLIAPGSPYHNDAGVYRLIQWCRENNLPLYGMCGGFQYMVVEYARNVLRFGTAGHEESDSKADMLIIAKMSCSLKGQQETVLIADKQSLLYEALHMEKITGQFNCSYGVNPLYQNLINQYPFIFTAFSANGEPRALEVKAHRFYCGTLFQPSLDSTKEKPNPLILSFLNKCGLY
jgi:CTP synthase (UTP-ammonia lyase)